MNCVFLFTRQGDKEAVQALNLADGKPLWTQSYAAPFSRSLYAMSHGKGAKLNAGRGRRPLVHPGDR